MLTENIPSFQERPDAALTIFQVQLHLHGTCCCRMSNDKAMQFLLGLQKRANKAMKKLVSEFYSTEKVLVYIVHTLIITYFL